MLGICFFIVTFAWYEVCRCHIALAATWHVYLFCPRRDGSVLFLVNGCLCHWARARSTLPW